MPARAQGALGEARRRPGGGGREPAQRTSMHKQKSSHMETFYVSYRRNASFSEARRGNVRKKSVSTLKSVSTSRSPIGTSKPFSQMRQRGNVRKILPALAPWKRFIPAREKAYPWKRFERFPRRELEETFPRVGTRKGSRVATLRPVETFCRCLDAETFFDGYTFWRDTDTWKRFLQFAVATRANV